MFDFRSLCSAPGGGKLRTGAVFMILIGKFFTEYSILLKILL